MHGVIGAFEGKRFVLPVRVCYYETDAGGVVHHSNYLRLLERCRTEMLRALGYPVLGLDGSTYLLREARVEWLKPARLDDNLLVTSRVSDLGAAQVTFVQTVERGRDVLFRAEIRAVFVNSAMRPLRFPKDLRAEFTALI